MKNRVSYLKNLPWDLLNVILNFLGKESLKSIQMIDKQFNKLCIKRKQSLVFSKKDVVEKVLFSIIERSVSI